MVIIDRGLHHFLLFVCLVILEKGNVVFVCRLNPRYPTIYTFQCSIQFSNNDGDYDSDSDNDIGAVLQCCPSA